MRRFFNVEKTIGFCMRVNALVVLCDAIADGESLEEFCEREEIDFGLMTLWIASSPRRQAGYSGAQVAKRMLAADRKLSKAVEGVGNGLEGLNTLSELLKRTEMTREGTAIKRKR